MSLEFPYQIVTFLSSEPQCGEPVYYGVNGWYPQVAIKRRFRLDDFTEEDLISRVKAFFVSYEMGSIKTGVIIKPDDMPVRVVDIPDQGFLGVLHNDLITGIGDRIVSRYPDRDGVNYYAHVTIEHRGIPMFAANEYIDKQFTVGNVWLLKDVADENSTAFVKLL